VSHGRRVLVAALLMAPALWPAESAGQISAVMEPDARSNGMGGAFTAVAEGPAAVWWNPGALAFGQGIQVSPFSRRQLLPELNADTWIYSIGASASSEGVGCGVHYSYLSYGESELINGDMFESTEYTLQAGGGIDLVPILTRSRSTSERIRWGLGTSWRYSHSHFASSNPDPSGAPVVDGSGWDMDLGSLFILRFPFEPRTRPGTRNWFGIRAGAHWSSIFHRDQEFDNDRTSPLARSIRVGGGIDSALFATTLEDALLRVLLCIEHEDFLGEHAGGDRIFHYGGEIEVSPLRRGAARLGIALRFGAIDNEDGGIEDSTAGFGLRLRPGQAPLHAAFDFATIPVAEELGGNDHQYSVSFRWQR
jgi:hypothetical protein